MVERYLNDAQMAALVETIEAAEELSTGEIRVHIDSATEGNMAQAAVEVFRRLQMDKTAERNGVLFHVNFNLRYLTIIGDEGINRAVSQGFWDKLHDETTNAFAKGFYFEGLRNAVVKTGAELKRHFPITDKNPNELSNDITFS